jgi:uncharacterized membrane protein YGL010W
VVKADLLRTDDLLKFDYSIGLIIGLVSEAVLERMKQALLIELLLSFFISPMGIWLSILNFIRKCEDLRFGF